MSIDQQRQAAAKARREENKTIWRKKCLSVRQFFLTVRCANLHPTFILLKELIVKMRYSLPTNYILINIVFSCTAEEIRFHMNER